MKKAYLDNLRGLDILRFVLSISVITWHYQHFFYPFTGPEHNEAYLHQQPFFGLFKLFYTNGYYAVHIFWMISGIIFYKVYAQSIAQHRTGFRTFIVNRFSRLYPLHLLMIIAVILLQYFYFNTHGNYFIYPHNGWKELVQNLLFVQSWGSNKFSFNGPTWSVSIEILIYLAFFACCTSGFLKNYRSTIATFLFFAMIKRWQLVFVTDDITTCFYFFFAGCVLIKSLDMLQERKPVLLIVTIAAMGLWLLAIRTPAAVAPAYQRITNHLDLGVLWFAIWSVTGSLWFFNLRIFDRLPSRVFRFFGDMTYSTYLVHFPLQLLFCILLKPANYEVFLTKQFFLVYLVTVILAGRIFYKYFEVPAQNWLRKRLTPEKASIKIAS